MSPTPITNEPGQINLDLTILGTEDTALLEAIFQRTDATGLRKLAGIALAASVDLSSRTQPIPPQFEDDWYLVPLTQLTTPHPGAIQTTAIFNHHWLIDAQDNVRFWTKGGAYAYQANLIRQTAERIAKSRLYDWALRVEHLPVAFLPPKPIRSTRASTAH